MLAVCQAKAPDATVIMTAIFPRNDSLAVIPTINQINRNLARMADGRKSDTSISTTNSRTRKAGCFQA